MYDVVDFWEHLVLLLSSPCYYWTKLYILPPFQPNEYMLEKHAHRSPKGEPWEIYAECVREAMAIHGKFATENRPIRDKLTYEELMNGRED